MSRSIGGEPLVFLGFVLYSDALVAAIERRRRRLAWDLEHGAEELELWLRLEHP